MEDEDKLDNIVSQFNSGDKKGATAELATFAAQLSPSSPIIFDAFKLLGRFYIMLGDVDNAGAAWTSAIVTMETQPDLELDEEKLGNYILLCESLAQTYEQQGRDGSGVVRKKNSISYGPTKTASDAEEEEWKKTKFNQAIAYYNKGIQKCSKFPGNRKEFCTAVAGIYTHLQDHASAIGIYEQAHKDEPDDPEWLTKWAGCLIQLGQTESGKAKLEEVLQKHPRNLLALQELAKFYKNNNDADQERELKKKISFYRCVPSFCRHIEYTPENEALLHQIMGRAGDDGDDEDEEDAEQDREAEETGAEQKTEKDEAQKGGEKAGKQRKEPEFTPLQIVQQLSNRNDDVATEFLAVVCYLHIHGVVENTAFDALHQRAAGNEHVCNILYSLLQNHSSVCTIKGVINILAHIKHPEIFEMLMRLLPQDTQPFPMHVPNAIATLKDERAVPALIDMLDLEKPDEVGSDSDSDDFIFTGMGKDRLRQESCLALFSSFHDHPEVQAITQQAKENKDVKDCVYAALWVARGDPADFEFLENRLENESDNFDTWALYHLKDHAKDGQTKALLQKRTDRESERKRLKAEEQKQKQEDQPKEDEVA